MVILLMAYFLVSFYKNKKGKSLNASKRRKTRGKCCIF
jgi:hypothetical protein